MNPISCYYFTTASGRSPVEDFIKKLDARSRRKFFYAVSLLQFWGQRLPEPHAKYLGREIFELRFSGHEGAVRILYFFFDSGKAVFTNGFLKKTNKTPSSELGIAIERRKIYLASKEAI